MSILGLSYVETRYYDPMLGRFMANDPVGFSAETPATLQNSVTQPPARGFRLLSSIRHGFPNRLKGKKHHRGIAVEGALPQALKWHEAIAFIESNCVRLGISQDADTAETVALIERELQYVPE